jgi:putative nucleotidyltransferase with HDIG domain
VASEIHLLGVSPSVQGLRWQSEQRLRVGRQTNLEIALNDSSLPKLHIEVRRTPQGWVVQEMEAGAGALLNGVPIGKVARKLQREDVLQCGKHTFQIEQLKWDPPTAAPVWPQDIRTSGPVMRVQAFSQLSWEQGLRELTMENTPVPHAKQFLTLLRAGYHLSRIDSMNELLQSLLDDTVAALGAQRGAILLADSETGELALKTFAGDRNRKSSRLCSMTLAQRCFSKGESLLCFDSAADANVTASVTLGEMTSIICALLRSPRRRLGVLHLDRGPRQLPFTQEDFKLADAVAATVSVGIEGAVGVDKQRGQFLQEVLELAQSAMAVHNPEAAQHCKRTCTAALALADALRMSRAEKDELQLGALLHDIGMIVPHDSLLAEPEGALDGPEDGQRQHPLQGVAIAEKISAFAPALPIIRSHHECWDGSGYPDGLHGDQIPRAAQIIALADAVDHYCAELPAGKAIDHHHLLSYFEAQAGRRFNPELVAALSRIDLSLLNRSTSDALETVRS